MTKVLTSTLALMLQERVGEPCQADEVAKYIPSFGRAWDVVEAAGADAQAPETVKVRSMISGVTESVPFVRRKPPGPMLVKHLMAECSGIGYELFSDLDKAKGDTLGTKGGYAIANALRRQRCPTVYTSSCILGHDLSIEEFCEVIADAGVLCTDPGVISYGLGASVLGRIVEVVYAKHFEPLPLREIFRELIFRPLGMNSAVFYDKGLDGKLPVLYGLSPVDGGEPKVVRAAESVPAIDPPYSNQSDHFSGPMKYDSGDTGSVMTVGDYAKFLDCLLRGGAAEDGTQVLSSKVVQTLLNDRHAGLSFDTGIGNMMKLSVGGAEFSYGWVTQNSTDELPKQNFWSGYAGTHVRLYPEDNSYIIQGIQCMDHCGTGFLDSTLRQPCLSTFLQNWTIEGSEAKRQRCA
mmetsp:Transcript_94671/g.167684  ORF Transcript_94671/g.167684 Transcript_94671/m.167684 type:complete len:406 (-) Transcript_94671:78-1295(-)